MLASDSGRYERNERAKVQVFTDPHDEDTRNALFCLRVVFERLPAISSRDTTLGSRKGGEFVRLLVRVSPADI